MNLIRDSLTAILFASAGALCVAPPFSGAGLVFLPAIALANRYQPSTLRSLCPPISFVVGLSLHVPLAAMDSEGSVATALGLWGCYLLLTALLVRWAQRVGTGPMISAALLMAAPSVPPLAFIYVIPPLTSAGWWFPGTGVAGAALVCSLAGAFVQGLTASRWGNCAALCGFALLCNAMSIAAPAPPSEILGVTLPLLRPPTTPGEEYHNAIRLAKAAVDIPPPTAVLMPENSIGILSKGTEGLLRGAHHREVIVGGKYIDPITGSKYKGAWVSSTGRFFPAIQPIPFVESELSAHWSALGKFIVINDREYTLLVCFEASTSLPLYHLAHNRPILYMANGWWDRHNVMQVQQGFATSWARLFHGSLTVSASLGTPDSQAPGNDTIFVAHSDP